MNSIMGFMSLRIKKNNSITILCEADGDEGYNTLKEIENAFKSLQ